MNFQKKLKELKTAINKELEYQLDIEIRDVQKKDDLMAKALVQTKKIALAGGKRMRGALLCQAYFGLGGKEKKKIFKIAAAIELAHLFCLVHDDIIDRGNLRHGQTTLHKFFVAKKAKGPFSKDAMHYGNSMAIVVGDFIYALAIKIITQAGFADEITVRAMNHLQSIILTTVIGQGQDIEITYKKNVTEKDVFAMYGNKTARYSIEGPLHMGAIFAGCNSQKMLNSLSNYAMPIGIAFQIQDDILGVFGNETKIGKSTASDISEGKQSIAVVKARELSSSEQKRQLNSILGKKNLTNKEIKKFQDIIRLTGALEYSKKMSAKYLKKGKKEMEQAIILPNAKNFFIELVEYLENREI